MTDSSGGSAGGTDDLLMEAAYHALCDHGYGEFSLRKVAAEAGKSRGLLHYHFDSKNDLLVKLLEYLIDEFDAHLDSTADESPLDRLDALLSWVAFGPSVAGRDGDAYFTAIFELRAQAPYDDAIRARLTRNFETVRDRCAAIIQDGIEQGDFRHVDADQTATFLVSAVDGARNTDLTLDATDTREQSIAAIETFVFDTLTPSNRLDG